MLKWAASAQKLNIVDSPVSLPRPKTRGSEIAERRRRSRRATIANKENIPYATSTPMVPSGRATRNSPLVLAPLADILNITPEASSITSALNVTLTPETRRLPTTTTTTTTATIDANTPIQHGEKRNNLMTSRSRRHSTIGITLPSAVPFYARTLPRFQVEEYSPNAATSSPQLPPPTGQQLALRGLFPDPFLTNARYFQTPDIQMKRPRIATKSQLKKRNLDADFAAENAGKVYDESKCMPSDLTGINSSKMGNETLDKLIDAILDSARKDVKKKKSRKSFNLRRRTLLKSHTEEVENIVLSPSYAAGDDPASDLSFLLTESKPGADNNASTVAIRSLEIAPTPKMKNARTPSPATPPPGTPKSQSILCQLETPIPADIASNVSTTTFKLETPVRTTHARKRRQTSYFDAHASTAHSNRSKKFKVDARNYFEIGVALPSIYV